MPATIKDLFEARFGLETQDGADQPAEGTVAQILAHRTRRRFLDRPVDQALLRIVLACGFSAPSKSDLQQASVIVVDDADLRAEITGLLPSMPWIAEAPVFLVMLADSRRVRRLCSLRGRPFANDHLDSVINAAVDAGLVMQNIITAAESVGLGCCPISVIRNHAATVSALFALPDQVFPLAGLCLGWPADDPSISLRLPPALTVHHNRYDDQELPALVDDYDRRRDARQPIDPSAQRRVRAFGRTDFYGWSEDKARQVSRPEREDFGTFLKSRGLSLD
jgi:nitroreductase/FMN reductase [NAD(P)H]